MLRRFEFIIMVTWKEFGTSINRRAISLKVDRFHQEFYLDLKSDFIISYLDSTQISHLLNLEPRSPEP